jgi:hypothetical protein
LVSSVKRGVAIDHIVPLDRENRWTDLLAVLIETDPLCAASLLGLGDRPRNVRARREVSVSERGRVDLLIDVDGQLCSVVEVKVLSGLGRHQLSRYRAAFPNARSYVLVFPERLPIGIGPQPMWSPVTWEAILGAFARSRHPWVAETASAWSAHLKAGMPNVSASTAWNDLRDGEDFILAMRTRMAWVFGALRPPDPITHDLVPSGAGVGWAARMNLDAAVRGYRVRVEAEERLPVRSYPKWVSATSVKPIGPSVKVCLVQGGVSTSAGFDWDYLLALWPLMKRTPIVWVTRSAVPRAAHDRVNWRAMVDSGAPRYLGIGFGDAQAKRSHECMFGARFQLAPDVKLSEVVDALTTTTELMREMAAWSPGRFDRETSA